MKWGAIEGLVYHTTSPWHLQVDDLTRVTLLYRKGYRYPLWWHRGAPWGGTLNISLDHCVTVGGLTLTHWNTTYLLGEATFLLDHRFFNFFGS